MNNGSHIFARATTIIAIAAATTLLAGCSLINSFIGGNVEGEGDSTDIFTIAVGDCLNDAAAEESVSTVPTVDCSEPHDSEVYGTVILDDGEFPGDDAILEEADSGCLAQFAPFMGVEYEESIADIQYYFPTEFTWATGDREILCIVYATDGAGAAVQTTGSLAGSGL